MSITVEAFMSKITTPDKSVLINWDDWEGVALTLAAADSRLTKKTSAVLPIEEVEKLYHDFHYEFTGMVLLPFEVPYAECFMSSTEKLIIHLYGFSTLTTSGKKYQGFKYLAARPDTVNGGNLVSFGSMVADVYNNRLLVTEDKNESLVSNTRLNLHARVNIRDNETLLQNFVKIRPHFRRR